MGRQELHLKRCQFTQCRDSVESRETIRCMRSQGKHRPRRQECELIDGGLALAANAWVHHFIRRRGREQEHPRRHLRKGYCQSSRLSRKAASVAGWERITDSSSCRFSEPCGAALRSRFDAASSRQPRVSLRPANNWAPRILSSARASIPGLNVSRQAARFPLSTVETYSGDSGFRDVVSYQLIEVAMVAFHGPHGAQRIRRTLYELPSGDVAEIIGGQIRKQRQPHVGRRRTMADQRDRVLLIVIGRQPMIVRADEGLEELPCLAGNFRRNSFCSSCYPVPRWTSGRPIHQAIPGEMNHAQ